MRLAYVLLGLASLTSLQNSTGTAHDPIPALDIDAQSCGSQADGISDGNVCCSNSCGDCEDDLCWERPGGVDECCPFYTELYAEVCSTSHHGPCILDPSDDTTGNPIAGQDIGGDMGGQSCGSQADGISNGLVCCSNYCGKCDDYNCWYSPGGLENCCPFYVERTGPMCSASHHAPCILNAFVGES